MIVYGEHKMTRKHLQMHEQVEEDPGKKAAEPQQAHHQFLCSAYRQQLI